MHITRVLITDYYTVVLVLITVYTCLLRRVYICQNFNINIQNVVNAPRCALLYIQSRRLFTIKATTTPTPTPLN